MTLNGIVTYSIVLIVTTLQYVTSAARQGPFGDEARLLSRLMKGYDKYTRPLANASHTITVRIDFTLTQILDVDDKNQFLTTNVWFSEEWRDEKMTWDPDEFNGLTKIRIPDHLIWKPDIVLYNSIDISESFTSCLAMVDHNGNVLYGPIANFKSSCKLNLKFFPFDDQICDFKIGSWSYDGFQVDLVNTSDKINLEQYSVNGGWDIVQTRAIRNELRYPCCPEPYIDVTFTLLLRRRSLYYILNVVVPCLLLSCLSIVGFFLPVDTSEKVTLGLTVLLAYYVLSLSISERIPETSEFVPLIVLYLMVIMTFTSISIAMCVYIIHIHNLGSGGSKVPNWLWRFVKVFLSKLVGMSDIFNDKHRHKQHSDMAQNESEILRLHTDDDSEPISYKLIQIERNKLYVLVREGSTQMSHPKANGDVWERFSTLYEDKLDNNKVFKARVLPCDGDIENSPRHSEEVTSHTERWHLIALVVDRTFFWLSFFTVIVSTICLLVIVPLSKPELQL